MSKLTTDELVEWLGGQICTERGLTPVITKTVLAENRENLARTIAKLRAADALVELLEREYFHGPLLVKAIRAYEEAGE